MVIDSTLAGFLRYSQRYTEGSAISGAWFLDDLVLGDAPQRNPPARRAVLGCHDAETRLFLKQRASGIVSQSFPNSFRTLSIFGGIVLGSIDADFCK